MVRNLGRAVLWASLIAASPSHAQTATATATEKFVVREGFAFPAGKSPRILVFRPEVKVGEQTTAGLLQVNAEWHATAKGELTEALLLAGKKRNVEMLLHEELAEGEGADLAEHRALFRMVVGTIIRHKLFGKEPLPSKVDRFDWSIGGGVARIVPAAQAEYGLFLLSQDSFESAGRRAAKLVASLMGGGEATGSHFGYAALVDLKSGDILWLNVDLKAAGDVRTAEGAALRIEQLLNGFPARAASGQALP